MGNVRWASPKFKQTVKKQSFLNALDSLMVNFR